VHDNTRTWVTDRESASPTVEHCFRVGVALGSGISRPLRDWEPFKQPYALPVASTIGQYDDTHLYSRWSAGRHTVHTCVCVCVCVCVLYPCTHMHRSLGVHGRWRGKDQRRQWPHSHHTSVAGEEGAAVHPVHSPLKAGVMW
jgi:hypothetical protein